MASKTCKCQQCAVFFVIDEKEQAFLSKLHIPEPILCFDCGQKQRLIFRNSRSLYNRKCDHSGEAIISIYSPDKPYQVYKSDYWFSDQWDATNYGQDVDFSKPFFPQLKELQLKVPRLALLNFSGENSDYCNSCVGNKNCYLIFGGDHNQDCLFGNLSMHNESTVDADSSNQNKLCYMLGDSTSCYNCQFIFDSKNCSDSYFLSDCSNCKNCILCTNLNSTEYHINNQPVSKELFEQTKKQLLTGSYQTQQKFLQAFQKLRAERKVKFTHTLSCEDSSGDYLKSCKGCQNCYDSSESQDLQNVLFGTKASDCVNSSMLGDNTKFCSEVISTSNAYESTYSFGVLNSRNVEYSDLVLDSHDIFGCVCIQRQQYCILNKPYSKDDFTKLRDQLIAHMKQTNEWGKFLPKDLSCFGYNESCAQEYYPLKRDQALQEGFNWYDGDNTNSYQGPTIAIPDTIDQVSDEICRDILTCNVCQKNYRVVSQELAFYRTHKIPVPRSCHNCRYQFRQSLRNPRKLYPRACANCKTPFETTYAPERPETVLCETCYQQLVFK